MPNDTTTPSNAENTRSRRNALLLINAPGSGCGAAAYHLAVSSLVEYTEQIRSGQLRVLAVSGPERVPWVEAPTLTESGIDLVFTNWRGVIAPPGISDADRTRLVQLFHDLEQTPEWRYALAENSWTAAFLDGDEFAAFLRSEDERVRDSLAELGLG